MVDATIPNLLQIRKIPDYDNLRYADDITLMAESEEELKSLLKVKESEKVGLKTQHSENEDHGIGPIT